MNFIKIRNNSNKKKSVMIQKIKCCKKFDFFGRQFSETCLRMHTFNKIPLSN